MTWTYTGDPLANDRDEVRFLVGDTDTTAQQITDEEIAYAIAESSTGYSAAAIVVESLIAKYARFVDEAVGDLKLTFTQRVTHYETLLKKLERKQAIYGGTVYAGGISHADKDINETDTDVVQSHFKIGRMDNAEHTDDEDDHHGH